MPERLRLKGLDPTKPIAVIDIGSNTVRLEIFEGAQPFPRELFNDRYPCRLGGNATDDGKPFQLPAKGKQDALTTLARFGLLIDKWDPPIPHSNIIAIGTSALREATDGKAFVNEVRNATGIDIQIISGDMEGNLSARGLLAGIPDADGIIADQGGGSIELVDSKRFVQNGLHDPKAASLPLGALRMTGWMNQNGRGRADRYIEDKIASISWLKGGEGRTFYCIGGSWRRIAKLYQDSVDYPLKGVHNYEVDTATLLKYLETIVGERFDRKKGGDRADILPASARVLKHILQHMKPRNVVFSEYGLREGMVALQSRKPMPADPLLYQAQRCFSDSPPSAISQKLYEWLDGLPLECGIATASVIKSVCAMSDRVAKYDYSGAQGAHAYNNIINYEFAACTPQQRAFMALAMFARYEGDVDSNTVDDAVAMLDRPLQQRALILGLSLRLAYRIAGQAADLLEKTTLKFNGNSDSNPLEVLHERDAAALFELDRIQHWVQSLKNVVKENLADLKKNQRQHPRVFELGPQFTGGQSLYAAPRS